jgi:hypothetical protein
MSKDVKSDIKLECPACKKQMSMQVRTNVNGAKHAQDVKRILDGTFFLHKCESCGHMSVVAFPVVYQKTNSKKKIFFLPADTKTNADVEKVPDGSRITHDVLDFVEKVCIAEHDMDDKIIEIVKIVAYNQVVQLGKVPNGEVSDISCWINDNKAISLSMFVDNKRYLLDVPYKMYIDIDKKFSKQLQQYSEPKIVDLNWAMMILNADVIEEDAQTAQTVNDDDWDEIVF